MEDLQRVRAAIFLGLTEHVQSDAVVDVLLSADAIERLLHFAVAPMPPFHGIRGGRQQFVSKKRQRLVQVGRLKLPQDLADLLATLAQLGQRGQRSVGATPADQRGGRLPP